MVPRPWAFAGAESDPVTSAVANSELRERKRVEVRRAVGLSDLGFWFRAIASHHTRQQRES